MSQESSERCVSREPEFPGHLIHQAIEFDNCDLLQDLMSGDEVRKYVDCLKLLNCCLDLQKLYVQSTDANGRTALHKSVEMESIPCTKLLLESGGKFLYQ